MKSCHIDIDSLEKTKHGIFNAFIELRSMKPLERICVKELCDNANINKSTFYAHYRDIYDLSDKIENEITTQIMSEIDINDLINRLENLPKQLAVLYTSKQSLISTIFSGSRTQEWPKKVLNAIIERVNETHSDLADKKFKIMLTYSVYGGYYAFNENSNYPEQLLIGTLSEISERLFLVQK